MLAMLAAAVLATSQPAPVVRPKWERQPSPDELMDAYPPGAEAKGVEGRAVMVCTVTVYGDMDDCVIVSQTPPGWGFGDAALRVSLRLHMSPQLRNGEPEPSRVRIPVRFALPKTPAPVSAPTPASTADTIERMCWLSSTNRTRIVDRGLDIRRRFPAIGTATAGSRAVDSGQRKHGNT